MTTDVCLFHAQTSDGLPVDDWILDTGSSINLTCNYDALFKPQPIQGSAKSIQGTLRYTHFGTCKFTFPNADETKTPLILDLKVFYSPDATFNLFSPQCLYELNFHDHTVNYKDNILRISTGQDSYRMGLRTHFTADGSIRMFNMQNDNSPPDSLASSPPFNSMIELACALPDRLTASRLHALLGHQSFDRCMDLFHRLYPKKAFKPFNLKECPACCLNKPQTGSYGSVPTKHPEWPLQYLRMNLSGLIPCYDGDKQHISFQGYKCFILIKDEYSHYLWFYPLHDRQASTVIAAVYALLLHLQNMFPGNPVAEIVSDAGTEFTNKEFGSQLQSRGIHLTHTPPGESQLNGLIEREMRSIKNAGNTLLTAAGLPKAFWPQAYHHAVHLHNLMYRQRRYEYMPPPPPESTTNHFYPFLALYGATTSQWLEAHENFIRHHLEHLAIFGQSGLYLDPLDPRKLDKHQAANAAEPAIYLGAASVHFTSHIYVLLPWCDSDSII